MNSILWAIPSILPVLVAVTAFCLGTADVLRRRPVPFYAGATALCVLKCLGVVVALPSAVAAVTDLLASAYVGVAFYLLVMFAGAFDKRRTWVKRLLSIRSEMSIIGGIVIMAHCIRVAFMPFLAILGPWDDIWGSAALPMFLAVAVVGPALTVCFLVPWVTSFKRIRSKMTHTKWKKVQRLAYPFMFLMVAQGVFLGIGHAAYVWENPASYPQFEVEFVKYALTAAVYAAFGVAYAALKLRQRSRKRARHAELREKAQKPQVDRP